DGYAPTVHRRAVFARPGCWIVADRVLGDGEHEAAVHWHLDPRWTITAADDGWLRADDGAGPPLWIAAGPGAIEIVRGGDTDGEPGLGWVAPAYGRLVPSTTLQLIHRGAAPFALTTVVVEAAERPSIEWLTPRLVDAADGSAVGLRLAWGDASDVVVFG